MGKTYSGGVNLATGFKLGDAQPIADYMVVDLISDLAALPFQFIGMTSYVLQDQNPYIRKSGGWEIQTGFNMANANLIFLTNRTHNLSTNKVTFTNGRFEVPTLEMPVTTPNSISNKVWNDGVHLYYTTALGVQRILSNTQDKLDRLITTAQSVASQVTFLGNIVHNPPVTPTIKSAVVLNAANEFRQADVVELMADDGSVTKYTTQAELDALYPTAISGFELICPNISTASFPNGVIYKKTNVGWRVQRLYTLADV